MNIFEFLDYKIYLKQLIAEGAKQQKGYQSRLCEVMRCSRPLLSQIINGKNHLSHDHAFLLSKYCVLTEPETHHLFLMLSYAKAGVHELKDYYLQKLKESQKSHNQMASTLPETKELSLKDLARYTSHWLYPAIRSSLLLEEGCCPQRISQLLFVSPQVVITFLQNLEEMNLVYKKGGLWFPTQQSLHIPGDSPFASHLHTAWSLKTIDQLKALPDEGTHYSGVHVVSKEFYEEYKKAIRAFIKKFHGKRDKSEAEQLTFLGIHFYSLKKD